MAGWGGGGGGGRDWLEAPAGPLTGGEESTLVAKVPVTTIAALIVTVQSPVPEQPPPDQPVKKEPGSLEAIRLTVEPSSKPAEQLPGQEIPAG